MSRARASNRPARSRSTAAPIRSEVVVPHHPMRRLTFFSFVLLLNFTPPGFSAPVTAERVAALPAESRMAWTDYLARSQSRAGADAAALAAEFGEAGPAAARRAPSGGDFKLSRPAGDAWYASSEAAALAEVILSYQTPSGGWSKHTGYAAGPRPRGTQWSSQYAPGSSPHYLATFDNRSTTEQLRFLAAFWSATRHAEAAAALRRGVDYALAAQYPDGGWPQVYPLEGGYHDHITFNDDAMTHVVSVLRDLAAHPEADLLLGAERRARSLAAVTQGLACILRLQIRINDRPAVWCAQYDPLTLTPAAARAMEPAALSGLESSRILDLLMDEPAPTPELVAAIEGALAWFESAKITGIGRVEQNGKMIYAPVPNSERVYWARFYDLATGRPVFPGRDGVLYASYAELAAKNPLGYDYYTSLPGSIVGNGQKKWRKRLAAIARP